MISILFHFLRLPYVAHVSLEITVFLLQSLEDHRCMPPYLALCLFFVDNISSILLSPSPLLLSEKKESRLFISDARLMKFRFNSTTDCSCSKHWMEKKETLKEREREKNVAAHSRKLP